MNQSIKKIIYTGCLAITFLLGGCQSIPQNESNLSSQQKWDQNQSLVSQIEQFQVNGSLAYLSDKTRSYGRFFINQQSPQRYQIRLSSPIGSTLFTLDVNEYRAMLIDANGEQYVDSNVEQLMYRLTGINIPLLSLHNWLKGLSNDPQNDVIDEQGRLQQTQIQQANTAWSLYISSYISKNFNNQNVILPSTLELTRQDEKVRLRMDNWNISQ